MALRLPKRRHHDFRLPGVKPTGPVEIDWSNPITRGMDPGFVFKGADYYDPGSAGIIRNTAYGQGFSTDANSASVWTAPNLRAISTNSQYSVFILFHQTDFTGEAPGGDHYYCERPNIAQIFKIGHGGSGGLDHEVSWVTRNSASGALQNMTTRAELDTSKALHTCCFVKASDSDRTIYGDSNSATNTSFSGGNYNPVTPAICGDLQDTNAATQNATVLAVFRWKRPLTEAEYQSLRDKPYQLLKPANAPRYFPALAGGGTTVNIGIASETDTALNITSVNPRTYSIGIASETDTSLSITAVNPRSYFLGLATETESALTITPSISVGGTTVSLGIASDTESVLSVTPSKTVSLGLPIETSEALSIAPSKTVGLGLAQETETALSVTVLNPRSYTVGIVTETETALPIIRIGGAETEYSETFLETVIRAKEVQLSGTIIISDSVELTTSLFYEENQTTKIYDRQVQVRADLTGDTRQTTVIG